MPNPHLTIKHLQVGRNKFKIGLDKAVVEGVEVTTERQEHYD
jgi:hypothetical protein